MRGAVSDRLLLSPLLNSALPFSSPTHASAWQQLPLIDSHRRRRPRLRRRRHLHLLTSAAPLTSGEPSHLSLLHLIPTTHQAYALLCSAPFDVQRHRSREYFPTHRQLNDHIDRHHRICTEQLDTMNKARGVEHSTATATVRSSSSSSKTGVYAPVEVWANRVLDKESTVACKESSAVTPLDDGMIEEFWTLWNRLYEMIA